MNSREFVKILLQWSTDETLDNLLSTPGLEFLYPNPGLQWVSYVGKSSARTVGGGVISFDPSKIKGVRCLAQEAVIEPDLLEEQRAKRVADLAETRKDLEKDTNSPPEDFQEPRTLGQHQVTDEPPWAKKVDL